MSNKLQGKGKKAQGARGKAQDPKSNVQYPNQNFHYNWMRIRELGLDIGRIFFLDDFRIFYSDNFVPVGIPLIAPVENLERRFALRRRV